MQKIKHKLITLVMVLVMSSGMAQKPVRDLSFDDFMQYVLANNLELIIENYEVSIAEAALVASRVFEDPELEVIFPMFAEEEFNGFPRNIEFEMEVPIELFGKRRNRIRQARAEKFAAEAKLDDFMRYLRADAAKTFIAVLTKQMIIERVNIELDQINQLIEVNQALLEAGEIGEIELIQTRLEARNFEAEVFDLKAEYAELISDVYFLMGSISSDSLAFSGDLHVQPALTSLADLREHALNNRSDIIAAQRQVEAGEFGLRLARAERLPDISLIMGYHNEEAVRPGPGFAAAYAGLVIPLKFSGFNAGEFRIAGYELEQSRTELQATILDVEAALNSAWEKIQLYSSKKMLFSEIILQDAERVRDAIVFSYQRGEVSLLEVLESQRTLNEIYMNYYETLSQFAESLVELSTASGQWLVDF